MGYGNMVLVRDFIPLHMFQVANRQKITLLHEIIYHSLQPHVPAIIRRINTGNPISLERFNLGRKNNAPAAAKQFYMSCATLLKQVIHIPEILIMATLVRCNGYPLHILIYGTIYNLAY